MTPGCSETGPNAGSANHPNFLLVPLGVVLLVGTQQDGVFIENGLLFAGQVIHVTLS